MAGNREMGGARGNGRWLAAAAAALLLLGPACEATPPAWVARLPHDPDRYIGIGHGDKRGHPRDYRERAQAAALAQIGREISVRLRARSLSTQAEDAAGFGETFSQSIEAVTEADLSGHRLEAVHETATDFWAYYSLDREAYHAGLEARRKARADRLDAAAEAIRARLAARRLPAAAEEYHRSYTREAGDLSPRFAAAAGLLEEACRGAALEAGPPEWIFDLSGPEPGVPRARASLVDRESRDPWPGPLDLILSRAGAPADSGCPLRADAEGRLDAGEALRTCSLAAGDHVLAWRSPVQGRHAVPIRVEVIKAPVGLWLKPFPGADADFVARLGARLSGVDHPRRRIVPGLAGGPAVEIDLREPSVDSLGGICFATLRGRVRFPGGSGYAEAVGKGGHPDRRRAVDRALGDFADDVSRRWEGPPPVRGKAAW